MNLSACARIANATLAIRNTAIWGDAGTACASDSKLFGACDKDMRTEWHARYGGRGVIYSQLKCCSSSQVASMIEGVLRHCTARLVRGQSQSAVGFAFSYRLEFELAPRFKAIARPKLALPIPNSGTGPAGQRDKHITAIASDGRLERQAATGYGLHGLIKTVIGRYKGPIGSRLRACSFPA
jgi:TnpA family transposase